MVARAYLAVKWELVAIATSSASSPNSGVNVPKRKNLLYILIGFYIILVIADSASTYIGIKYLGFVELTQSWDVIFNYYGLLPGVILSTASCLSFAWLFYKARRFKLISYLGLSALTLTVLVAVINNVGLILSR